MIQSMIHVWKKPKDKFVTPINPILSEHVASENFTWNPLKACSLVARLGGFSTTFSPNPSGKMLQFEKHIF